MSLILLSPHTTSPNFPWLQKAWEMRWRGPLLIVGSLLSLFFPSCITKAYQNRNYLGSQERVGNGMQIHDHIEQGGIMRETKNIHHLSLLNIFICFYRFELPSGVISLAQLNYIPTQFLSVVNGKYMSFLCVPGSTIYQIHILLFYTINL